MGIKDILKSDTTKEMERRNKINRITPLFGEATKLFDELEKNYPDQVSPELRTLFNLVGQKLEAQQEAKLYVPGMDVQTGAAPRMLSEAPEMPSPDVRQETASEIPPGATGKPQDGRKSEMAYNVPPGGEVDINRLFPESKTMESGLDYDVEAEREKYASPEGWEQKRDVDRGGVIGQALYGYTSGKTGGLLPAITSTEERELMQPRGSAERIARGAGEFYGFVTGAPMKVASKVVKKIMPKVVSPTLKSAATLAIANVVSGNENIVDLLTDPTSKKMANFFVDKLVSAGMGALTGTQFALIGKMPKFWERAAGNLIMSNIIGQASRSIQGGEMPPIEEIVYHSLMDLYFSRHKTPTKEEARLFADISVDLGKQFKDNPQFFDDVVGRAEKLGQDEIAQGLKEAYNQWFRASNLSYGEKFLEQVGMKAEAEAKAEEKKGKGRKYAEVLSGPKEKVSEARPEFGGGERESSQDQQQPPSKPASVPRATQEKAEAEKEVENIPLNPFSKGEKETPGVKEWEKYQSMKRQEREFAEQWEKIQEERNKIGLLPEGKAGDIETKIETPGQKTDIEKLEERFQLQNDINIIKPKPITWKPGTRVPYKKADGTQTHVTIGNTYDLKYIWKKVNGNKYYNALAEEIFRYMPEGTKAIEVEGDIDYLGAFNRANGHIFINRAKYKEGKLAETIIHEAVHSITVTPFERSMQGLKLNARETKFRNDMISFVNEILPKLPESHKKFIKKYGDNIDKVSKEFISYGLTNSRFIEALNKIQVRENKTGFSRLLELISKFLKINETAALHKLISTTAEYLEPEPLKKPYKPEKIELSNFDRDFLDQAAKNLEAGKLIKGGLTRDDEGYVVGRAGTQSTNPDWYRESPELQEIGKSRVLGVMKKVLAGKPLTEKQNEIYNALWDNFDEYYYKLSQTYGAGVKRPEVAFTGEREAPTEKNIPPAPPSKGGKIITAGELQTGDRVKINGEWLDVEDIPSKGEIKLKDGKTITVDVFDKIEIEGKKEASPQSTVGSQEKTKEHGKPAITTEKAEPEPVEVKTEKVEKGRDQYTFATGQKTMPGGKKKVKPGQQKVEQQEGGLFEKKGPKAEQGGIFDEGGPAERKMNEGNYEAREVNFQDGKVIGVYYKGDLVLTSNISKKGEPSNIEVEEKYLKNIGFDRVKKAALRMLEKAAKSWTGPEPENKAKEDLFNSLEDYGVLTIKDVYETSPKQKKGKAEADFGGYADRGGYDFTSPGIVEMPEIVELAQALGKGDFPKIKEILSNKKAGGQFWPFGKGEIDLRADIFIGNKIFEASFRKKFEPDEEFISTLAEKTGIDPRKFRFKWDFKNDVHTLRVYEYDPTLAGKVLSHEVGHWIDYLPQETMKRGNILGRIASLKNYTDKFLEEYPGGPGKLTAADYKRLKDIARKMASERKEEIVEEEIRTEIPLTAKDVLKVWNDTEGRIRESDPELYKFIAHLSTADKKSIVKEALKGSIPDWVTFKRVIIEKKTRIKIVDKVTEKAIKEQLDKLVKEEIIKRGLYERDVIMKELKKLTQIWKPFDEANEGLKNYRYSSVELYADAFSVLMNEPALMDQFAPTFKKAFFNYFQNKPEVEKLYKSIQDRIKNKADVLGERERRIREMFEHEKEKKPVPPTKQGLFSELKKIFIDREAAALKYADKKRKEIDPEDNPRYWLEELPYTSAKVYQMLRDVDNILVKNMEKHGLTREDFGELLFLRRVVGERSEMANPLGMGPKQALEQMGFIKEEIGAEKFKMLEDFVSDFWEIRDRHVNSVLEKANMFSPELQEKLKDNQFYATFNVLKYMDGRFGRGPGAKIYRQIGTLQEIGNPFMATIMKDAALIRAAERKIIMKQYVDFMKKNFSTDIREADYKIVKTREKNTTRVPKDSADPDYELIMYQEGGKLKGFYVPKEVAKTFNRDPYEAGKIYNVWQSLMKPFRSLFVAKNPFWSMWNVVRDVKASATKLPGGAFNLVRMIKYVGKSLPDAFQDVFKSYSTELVREMYENKMLLVGRTYRAKIAPDADTDFDRMMMSYSLSPYKYKNVVRRLFHAVGEALEKPGQFSERLVKIASYKMLKERQPEMGKKRAGHLVRTRGGSPDFYRRGTGYKFYNNLFMFSNAGKEGWRSSIEAWKEKPVETSWKIVAYDILPKLAIFAAKSGAVAWLGTVLNDDKIKQEGEALADMYRRIPEHDKTNYLTIPVGKTKSGKAVYLIQPHDFSGQVIAGLFWKLINSKDQSDISGIFDFAAGGLPYESLSPHVSIALDIYSYLRGKNPIDPWRNRPMIDETRWKAGGMIKFKEFAKQMFNRYGGRQLYSFPYDDLDRIKDNLQKVIDQPGLAGFFRRFLRVSDRGLYEELIQSTDIKAEERSQARATLAKNKAIIDHLNKDVITSKSDARQLYVELKKTGLDVGRFSDFYNRYVKYVGRKKGDIVYNALQSAGTTKKRAIILKQLLDKEMTDREVSQFLRKYKRGMVE